MDNPQPPVAPPTRYVRVKELLNAAQGSTDVSYQGYGRFWELPLAEFLKVEIYGVQMIASAGAESAPADGCAHCHPTSEASAEPGRGGPSDRGARSGLILGLRGQAPFDGTQFPRLLWGPTATQMAEADIQFIQDWIDAGCPENDDQHKHIEATRAHHLRLARGEAAHPPTDQPHNAHKGDPGQVRVRKNIEAFSPTELANFTRAIQCMQALDAFPQDERSFAYWAKMHADMCQHGWEQFLTWHRAYLYFFEQRLQDIDPTVTLPYWDWAAYADANKAAAKQNPPPPKKQNPGEKQFSCDTGIIPAQYGCWIDQQALDNLQGKIDAATLNKLANIKGQVFLSGNRLYQAAGITYQGAGKNGVPSDDDRIMNELQRANPLWHRQRWPGMNPSLISHYPTPTDIDRILQITDFPTWGSGPASNHFFGALESVHNFMHNFPGGANPNYIIGSNTPTDYMEPEAGHMTDNRVTAYDPIFWAHHTNVDRLWARWQELHPGVNPQVLNSPLPPFEMTVADTLSTHDLGYEYVTDTHYFPTNNEVGMVRFRSEAVAVAPHAQNNHRCVEVRLHNVQVMQRGANIRVFLNQPEANADTPIENNPHYVGHFMSFVGFCYGGPGHCDVPPKTQRPYDMRMRHHKTPGNLRFDATAAVQQLQRQQAPDTSLTLSVHLVVTDTQGRIRDDVLKLDGVSINFIQ